MEPRGCSVGVVGGGGRAGVDLKLLHAKIGELTLEND